MFTTVQEFNAAREAARAAREAAIAAAEVRREQTIAAADEAHDEQWERVRALPLAQRPEARAAVRTAAAQAFDVAWATYREERAAAFDAFYKALDF